MKIGRKYTQGFCIKPDYWGGARPPLLKYWGGGPVAPLAPLVPTPLCMALTIVYYFIDSECLSTRRHCHNAHIVQYVVLNLQTN